MSVSGPARALTSMQRCNIATVGLWGLNTFEHLWRDLKKGCAPMLPIQSDGACKVVCVMVCHVYPVFPGFLLCAPVLSSSCLFCSCCLLCCSSSFLFSAPQSFPPPPPIALPSLMQSQCCRLVYLWITLFLLVCLSFFPHVFACFQFLTSALQQLAFCSPCFSTFTLHQFQTNLLIFHYWVFCVAFLR